MNIKFAKRAISALAIALSLSFAGAAQAANPDGLPDALAPNSTHYLNSNPLGVDQQAGFTGAYSTVTSSLLVPFSGSTFSGLLSSWVIAGDTHNPLGGLNFVYQFSNIGSSPAGIHRMTVNGFAGFLTDVGFIIPTSSVTKRPTSVDRSSDGETVGWNYLPNPQCSPFGCLPTPGQLAVGQTTSLLVVYTNATDWTRTEAQFIDGSVAATTTFAPAAAIPEPETYALMLAGLGLMGFVAKRRKRQSV